MKKRYIYGIIFVLIGVLLLLTPNIIAPTCPVMKTGMFMKCHWMGNAVMGQGIAIILMGILFMAVKENKMAVGIAMSNIVTGIVTILLPLYLIGTCKMATMSCNTHTKPTIYLISGAYIILSVIYIMKENKVKEEK